VLLLRIIANVNLLSIWFLNLFLFLWMNGLCCGCVLICRFDSTCKVHVVTVMTGQKGYIYIDIYIYERISKLNKESVIDQ
jgi:hypothetical protein